MEIVLEVVRRFRNHYLLYYYLLFLCILGSCNLKNSTQNLEEREGVEDIDEDSDENDGNSEENASDSKENDAADTEFDEKNGSGGDSSDSDTDTDTGIFDDGGNVTENYPDMTGTWANLTVFKGSSQVPYIGSTLPAWAVMVSKVDIYSQENGELKAHTEMCRLKTGVGTKAISAIVPDSFAESLGNVDKTFYLSRSGDGGIRFFQDKLWEVRSCTLDDPENENLPKDINDDRVFDADGTGINGLRIMTSGVLNADAEILQKVSTILDGVLDENGEVHGIVTWFEAQSVMWTNSPALKNGAPTSPEGADPKESVFVFKRIDSAWDCRAVKENSAALFPEQASLYPNEFK